MCAKFISSDGRFGEGHANPAWRVPSIALCLLRMFYVTISSSQYVPESMKPAMSRRCKRFLVSARITAEGHFPALPTAGTHTLSRRGSSGHIPLSDPPKGFRKIRSRTRFTRAEGSAPGYFRKRRSNQESRWAFYDVVARHA
uniref:Uncharacterized protein n=1 Tax=Ixodes ricinus TaxID=34613 RepID=A0A6B0UU64_IXORI